MRLVGKKVERMNRFGDSICVELSDGGKMKLSPGAMSRLKITPTANRVGFAYPENDTETICMYVATDNDGIAVNKQGIATTSAHNRDVRSALDLPATGTTNVYLNETATEMAEYPGYHFYELRVDETPWDAAVEQEDVDEEMVDMTTPPTHDNPQPPVEEVQVEEVEVIEDPIVSTSSIDIF